MKAILIRQPWAWFIVNGFKNIENRDWATKFRGKVLVHSAKGMTQAEYSDVCYFCQHSDSPVRKMMRGFEIPSFQTLQRGGIIGMTEILDCVSQSESPWFFGIHGFVLGRSRALPFMPYKGQLGFFDVQYDMGLLK